MKKKAAENTTQKLIKKLRAQNKRLENILHISPAAFMIARAKDRALTEVNDAWTTMLGYSASELIGKGDGLSRLFRDTGTYSAILRTLDSGGEISNLRCYLHDADGKPRIVQLYATRFEEVGTAYYLFNFCDLTESLSNEKTVMAYDHKIRNLERALDASSLISVTDAQGTIIYANAKFCEVSEYTRDELLGQNHRIINSGHHSADFMRNLWQTITSGKVWHGEIRNRKKSGGGLLGAEHDYPLSRQEWHPLPVLCDPAGDLGAQTFPGKTHAHAGGAHAGTGTRAYRHLGVVSRDG